MMMFDVSLMIMMMMVWWLKWKRGELELACDHWRKRLLMAVFDFLVVASRLFLSCGLLVQLMIRRRRSRAAFFSLCPPTFKPDPSCEWQCRFRLHVNIVSNNDKNIQIANVLIFSTLITMSLKNLEKNFFWGKWIQFSNVDKGKQLNW